MSNGLFQQIEPKNKVPYEKPALESYRFVIFDLAWGAEKAETKNLLAEMVQQGLVSVYESVKLTKLIESEDYEALQLAKGIMQAKNEK